VTNPSGQSTLKRMDQNSERLEKPRVVRIVYMEKKVLHRENPEIG
jgi:hypothetical protein